MLYGSTTRNQPSRFLEEIPKEYCNVSKAPSLSAYSGGYSHGFFDDGYSGGGRSSYSSGGSFGGGFGTGPYKKASSTAAAKPTPKPAAIINYAVGERVKHKTFGEGMVLSLTPMGNDTLVEVAFDSVGTKKLMSNFANLTKV